MTLTVPSGSSTAIPTAETKTETPIERPWPECLIVALEEYLERWRPLLSRMTHRWTRPVGDAQSLISNRATVR